MTCDWCSAEVHEGAFLCGKCVTTLARALANVAAYYADLETLRTRRRAVRYDGPTTKGGKKEQPVGMDLRFAAVRRDTEGNLTEGRATEVEHLARNAAVTWARVVLGEWPNLTAPADNVPAVCAFLHSVTTAVAGQAWAVEMLRDFRRAENRLRGLVDTAPPKWYAGKCSAPLGGDEDTDCDVDLYARAERGALVCKGCGAEHDIAGRREVLLREAKDILVVATEAAGALLAWTDYGGSEAKLVDRIRKWHERGRLANHGSIPVNGKNRLLYRLGDIQDMMVADAQAEQTRRVGAA